jgi:hypothetical protein
MTDNIETVNLDTERLKAELADLSRLAESFGNSIVRSFADAAIHGEKLSDVLRELALSLAQMALTSALRPLGNLLGGLLAAPITASAAPQTAAAPVNVSVNIQTPDAQSFRQSQSQVAALMARAVARGQRNL